MPPKNQPWIAWTDWHDQARASIATRTAAAAFIVARETLAPGQVETVAGSVMGNS